MERHGHGWKLFSLGLAVLSIASASALVRSQPEFLNIDCGKERNTSYNDTRTGLVYTSDHEYVSTGEIHKVANPYLAYAGYFFQAYDLRSFPNGTRNCYTLPVKPGHKHLVRASFLYGNYDGLDKLPSFELHAGVNYWFLVAPNNGSVNTFYELIFLADSNQRSMDVCLVNTGGGTPFISALELRQWPDEMYPQVNVSQSLALLARRGITSVARYPDDEYDRIWVPRRVSAWGVLTTSLPVKTVSTSYQPPSNVLEAAAYPLTESTLTLSLNAPVDPERGNPPVHIFLHFAELKNLKANESRVFNITLNGKPWSDQVKPPYLQALTVRTTEPQNANPNHITLTQTSESTLPPIINAWEGYAITDMTGVTTAQQDVDAINAVKESYTVVKNWQGDPCSPALYIWEGLNCSSDESDGSNGLRIVSLNLTSSGLTGQISAALANLTQLRTLDLSRNNLIGRIPDFLASLPRLKYLDLSENDLEGPIPSFLLDRSKDGTLTLIVGRAENEKKKKTARKIIIPVAASIGFVVVVAGVAIVVLWIKKRKRSGGQGKIHKEDNRGVQWNRGSFCNPSPTIENKQFTYTDLVRITDNFNAEIGRGGFGPVYYGVLNDVEVAVKLLSKSSDQGPTEFQNEALLLTRIHHRHLVSLIGYCNENINNLALVYEYMAEGSLQDHLRGNTSKITNPLKWSTRLRVAIEAAQGLEYLHYGCKPTIVHRDLKTNNILLNQNFEAKIADFGLSKIFENETNTHITTRVMGTPGYLDPEYYITNKLTEKSDVYSFGIVLLELITGLPPIIKKEGNINLVEWVRKNIEQGDVRGIVDKRILEDCDINSIWRALETALSCTPPISIERPNIIEVISLLKDCLELEKANVHDQITSQTSNNTSGNFLMEVHAANHTIISNPSAR